MFNYGINYVTLITALYNNSFISVYMEGALKKR